MAAPAAAAGAAKGGGSAAAASSAKGAAISSGIDSASNALWNTVSLIAAKRSQKRSMDFNERMANTYYQRKVKDLRAAGLNPMLAYMSPGASSPSVGSNATSVRSSEGTFTKGKQVSNETELAKQAILTQRSQQELNSAQAEKTAEEKINTMENREVLRALKEKYTAEANATTYDNSARQVKSRLWDGILKIYKGAGRTQKKFKDLNKNPQKMWDGKLNLKKKRDNKR